METSFYMFLHMLLPLLLLFVEPSCSNNAAFKLESMGEDTNFTVRGVACQGAHCELLLNNHILSPKDHVDVSLSEYPDNTVVAFKLVEGLRADKHDRPPTSIILLAYDKFEPSIVGHPKVVGIDFNNGRILFDGTPKASWTEAQIKASRPLIIFPSWYESSKSEDKIFWRELSHKLMMRNDVPQAFHLWDDEREAFVKHRKSFSDPFVTPGPMRSNSLQASIAVAHVNPQQTASMHHQQSSSGQLINRTPHTHGGNHKCPDFLTLRFLNYFKVEGVSCLGQKCRMICKNYKVDRRQTQNLRIKLTHPKHQVLAFKAVLEIKDSTIYDLVLVYDPFWPEIGCPWVVTVDAHRERKIDGKLMDEVKSNTFPPFNHHQHADNIFWRRLTARWDDVIGIGDYQLWDFEKSEFSKYREKLNDPYASGSH